MNDDDQLMVRIQSGDSSAFNELVERYQGPLIGFFFRNTHDRRVLTILADISRNTDEDGEVRAAALGAIRRINSQRF